MTINPERTPASHEVSLAKTTSPKRLRQTLAIATLPPHQGKDSYSKGSSMRASILVAAHNEGDALWKTIRRVH